MYISLEVLNGMHVYCYLVI